MKPPLPSQGTGVAEAVFAKYDRDRSGEINLQEFIVEAKGGRANGGTARHQGNNQNQQQQQQQESPSHPQDRHQHQHQPPDLYTTAPVRCFGMHS